MRSQVIFLACLIASVIATPIPPRASPIIGVVLPSDIPVVAPKYDMGDSVERPAPSVVTPTVLVATTSTPATVNAELRPGARFHAVGGSLGHAVSTTSSQVAAQPAAAMGDAVSRPKAVSVDKREEEEE